MRKHLIGGNWKMHKNPAGTASFFETFLPLAGSPEHCEIVICPPFLDVVSAVKATCGTTIQIGAQDLYWENDGAFTGEVSGSMIKASGCSHVIVGHSERRRYFGETNGTVLKKTIAALDAGLTPIVCVGERQERNVETVLAEQFQCGIAKLSTEQFAGIVIGYEPVWAIGDGESATPQVAADAHRLIRAQAEIQFGVEASKNVRILYGGSVKPGNAKSLMAEPEIDGFLVGGASLDPVSFAALVNVRYGTEVTDGYLMETLETILVVDDIDAVLNLVVTILEAANFHVLRANSGAGAVKLAADYSGKIDLLLSDVQMPEMSGPQLGDALKQARPDIHVMFMSGFVGGDLLVLNYGWAFIDKPFVPKQLVEMVNAVLHSPDKSQGNHRFDTRKK